MENLEKKEENFETEKDSSTVENIDVDTINKWIGCDEIAGKILWVNNSLWDRYVIWAFRLLELQGVPREERDNYATQAVFEMFRRFKENPQKYQYTNVPQWFATVKKALPGLCSNLAKECREKRQQEVVIEEEKVEIIIYKDNTLKEKLGESIMTGEIKEFLFRDFSLSLKGKLKEYFDEICMFYDTTGRDWVDFFYEAGKHDITLREYMESKGMPQNTFYTRNSRLRVAFEKFREGLKNSEKFKAWQKNF
jgi:hypothetical protein